MPDWKASVKSVLIDTKEASKAGVFGLDGKVWGKSDNFNPSNDEIKNVLNALDDFEEALESGLKFEGQEYNVVDADNDKIQGERMSGKGGFHVLKSGNAFVVAIYEGNATSMNCLFGASKLAEQIKNN